MQTSKAKAASEHRGGERQQRLMTLHENRVHKWGIDGDRLMAGGGESIEKVYNQGK